MYNGENKTAIASQNAVVESLIFLLKQKSFGDISISELCKESNISRQTFYSLFQSKENVIVYELKNKYLFNVKCAGDEKVSLQQICEYCYQYLKSNYSFLKVIVDNNIAHVLFNCIYDSLHTCENVIAANHIDDIEYFAYFTAGALTSIVKYYVSNSIAVDEAFIVKAYALFTGDFFIR